jgi:hypothetical protein
MTATKRIFQEVRKTIGNHHDKAIIKYYEHQQADKEQLEHIKGNKQNWK